MSDKTKAVPDVKPEVLELAGKVKEGLTIDNKTGIITAIPDLYTRLLPETVTKETIEALQAHNTRMVSATTLAVGEIAMPVLKKNKELEEASLKLSMVGKDAMNVTLARSRQVPSRNEDGTTGTQTKYGSVSVSIDEYSTGPRGDFKKVKQFLSEQAMTAFGK